MAANFNQLVINQVVGALEVDLEPSEAVAREEIERAVDIVSTAMRVLNTNAEIDEQYVCDEIETRFNIYQEADTALRTDEGHEPWLADTRGSIEWKFWDRYRQFLMEQPDFGPRSVNRLNTLTDEVLGDLESPRRSGSWDRRGLIVGQIQSGKTAAYSGLICKAADAGYKLIVVLAGLSNDLRSQTQLRIDEGFIGWDTQRTLNYESKNPRVGVGLITTELIRSAPLTTAGANGDFSSEIARQQGVIPGPDGPPVLLVIKKNVRILKNLYQWSTGLIGVTDEKTNLSVVDDVPLLVIDDEADYGSINTNPTLDENGHEDTNLDPTETNIQIRRLLRSFTKSGYVGFTATPFANVFISESENNEVLGRDLFPRHFIRNLKPPTNYIGPREMFGIREDISAGIAMGESLPLIRPFNDHDDWVPDGSGTNPRHKNFHIPGEIPKSLKHAISSFVLVCAARLARGHATKHNSMLIHVTRFNSVQAEVAEQVEEELQSIQRKLRHGDGSTGTPIREELKKIWDVDFVPVTKAVTGMRKDLMTGAKSLVWEEVNAALTDASQKIVVHQVNGLAKDSLDYSRNKEKGMSVIAIGGDKLSRGLTLEGLSISYFLRPTMLYDTLMQMGRWFGYRAGFADLCRLYTRPELASWFKHITFASEELRVEFDRMVAEGSTPEEYGLRVRRDPAGLAITSAGKMRRTTRMWATYSDKLAEASMLSQDTDVIKRNLAAVESLWMSSQPLEQEPTGWKAGDVPGRTIAEFFRSYVTHPRLARTHSNRIADFIASQLPLGELTNWTVVFRSSQDSSALTYEICETPLNIFVRSNTEPGTGIHVVSSSHIISGPDEGMDLSQEERQEALDLTRARWRSGGSRAQEEPTIAAGDLVRRVRSPKRGLLLVYLLRDSDPPEGLGLEPTGGLPLPAVAISFPRSEKTVPVEYQVGEVGWQQEMTL